jgi:hypothetical protein
MPLIGSDYLLNLALIAVSFVGFSTVAIALRQTSSSGLSEFHMHFVRLFIEAGFAVAASSLVPVALSTTSLSPSAIWQLSSAVAAVSWTWYHIQSVRRRLRVSSGPIPWPMRINMVFNTLALILLWENAAGFPFPPNAGPYLWAVTIFLGLDAAIFLQNLEVFVQHPDTQQRP